MLGPENLSVLGVKFFRRKVLADGEVLLQEQEESLDRQLVRLGPMELVGGHDERIDARFLCGSG